MTCETTTTGRISEPKIAFTKNGRPVLELNIHATRRTKNTHTNEWTDDGQPLWIRATFWDQEAERYADILHKGDTITITGPLTLHTYTRQDGTTGTTLEIRFPRLLGYIPKPQPATTPHTQAAHHTQTNAPF